MAYLAYLLSKRGIQIGSPSISFIVGPTPLDLFWPLQGHIILHVHGMLRCSAQALVGLNACFLTGLLYISATSTVYVPAQDSASPCPGKEGSFSAAPNTRV
ncbi:hypothetical protein QR685DRAFT_123818 [Neurospora intermedia]|uniref:Uncharacterized protein n=1 Tax=Neurospora intermedia TaxID=5142 RepID=A0ABR3CZ45_NEUIN